MIKSYFYDKDKDTKLSEHFKVSEFRCKDNSNVIFIDSDLVSVLEQIRQKAGEAIYINSAYRTPPYNKKIGGATYSQHMLGKAADIRARGKTPAQIASLAASILGEKGGIGTYDTFVHVDVREVKTRWKG